MSFKENYDELVQRIRNLDINTQPHWGSLTAPKLIAHLIDSMRFAKGEKQLEMKPLLLPKFLVKWFTIYSPVPWPKGIKVPQSFFEYDPQEFANDKEILIKLIDEFNALPETHTTEHPLMGTMSKKDWEHLKLRHFKHHFKQFGCPLK